MDFAQLHNISHLIKFLAPCAKSTGLSRCLDTINLAGDKSFLGIFCNFCVYFLNQIILDHFYFTLSLNQENNVIKDQYNYCYSMLKKIAKIRTCDEGQIN